VYLDESGFAHDMPRTHGYAPRGKRCYGVSDWGAKGRTNVIGAMIGACLITVSLFDCNINSDVFHAWAEQDLLPKVPEGAVIVMVCEADGATRRHNATFHKRFDTQAMIKNAGFILEYLPPYSPDLNPIEQKWAQAKAIRRKKQCSISNLFKKYEF